MVEYSQIWRISGGGVGGALFLSVFALCSHVPAAFILGNISAYHIPPPPQKMKMTQKKRNWKKK